MKISILWPVAIFVVGFTLGVAIRHTSNYQIGCTGNIESSDLALKIKRLSLVDKDSVTFQGSFEDGYKRGLIDGESRGRTDGLHDGSRACLYDQIEFMHKSGCITEQDYKNFRAEVPIR